MSDDINFSEPDQSRLAAALKSEIGGAFGSITGRY